jgi:hypothetical protein
LSLLYYQFSFFFFFSIGDWTQGLMHMFLYDTYSYFLHFRGQNTEKQRNSVAVLWFHGVPIEGEEINVILAQTSGKEDTSLCAHRFLIQWINNHGK